MYDRKYTRKWSLGCSFESGNAMLVITDEFDKYSAKKLRNSERIKGRILNAMRNCSVHENIPPIVVGRFADSSGEFFRDVYFISVRF